MGYSQASAALFLLLSVSTGTSTCNGQSGDQASKDPNAPIPDVTLPGVDTSVLTPRERRDWTARVTELLAPCSDVPVSVAQCVQEKRACPRCLPAARLVARMVRDGLSQEQIEEGYHARFDSDKVKNVDVGKAPFKGPEGAPLTLVEFADFECPYCAVMSPVLEAIWEQHKGELRYVYKFFPLSAHPHGEPAARAAVAAMNQGKFWEMHDKLFTNRDHLEQTDIDQYAKDIGLDLPKFHKDAESQATTDWLAADRKQADALGVGGTPTIYINGREYNTRQDLNDWITQELGGEVKTPAPAASPPKAPASGAASGAPPAAPSAKGR
jgi:protein-disulfide isomerase